MRINLGRMKITDIRACQPATPGSPPDWRTSLGQILVAVETDAGLIGYGVGGGGFAGIHIIKTVLRDLLLGRDPANVEHLWHEMYRATLPFGRKGVALMALSGVDIALWDLRGKAAGEPLARLLGGDVEQPIPTYATVWGPIDDVLGAGHQGIKLHLEKFDPRNGIDEIVAHVANARYRLGPDRELMVDAFMKWDIESTLKVAERIAGYNLAWLEEPLSPDNLAGYAELAEKCPIPIAGGEHEFTSAAFAELIQRKAHAVLQPDVCWCGGLTELIKIYHMAAGAGLRVCPHRGSEIWSLHAIAALDPQPLAESGRTWMTWVKDQPPIKNGQIYLTDAPGLGVDIDEANLTWL